MTTHAALSSLCLSALLAASIPAARAQNDAPAVAADVAVRMQARVIDARARLADAKVSEARRETLAASQQYNKALELVQGIGPSADPERSEAVAGLSRTTLQLADQAMKRAEYTEAELHLVRVLKVDPTNKIALEMRVQNHQLMEANKDKMPHPEALRTLADTETNRVEVARLVQDAKLYYETGRLKQAEDALRTALRMDPTSQGAHYYLDLVIAQKYSTEAKLREINGKKMLMEVEQAWSDPIKRANLAIPNSYARTNLVFTSERRQSIYLKLRNIRLPEWGPIDNLPLSEVVRQISDEIRRRDLASPGRLPGVNFIISGNADAAGGAAPAGAVDAAGLPIAPDPGGADLNAVTVRLGTKLTDLSIEEILNIIEKVAERRLKYSVEDFGILISPKAPEPTPLHTRFFHVDPNTFQQGLANVTAYSFGESQSGGGGGGGGSGRSGGGGGRGGGGGNRNNNNSGNNNNNNGGSGGGGAQYAGVSIAPGGTGQGGRNQQGGAARPGAQGGAGQAGQAGSSGGIAFLTDVTPSATVIPVVQNFFLTAGVTLTDPGKALFYNDRLGVLMVRATLADLDMIEKAMQILNMAPPQLTIRAKFMEVNQDDNRALGFDWFMGDLSLGGGDKVVGRAGTAPTLAGRGLGARRGGSFPNADIPTPPAPTDTFGTSGLRNAAPTVATITGILTDPQFRVVIRALEQRGASDLLSAPEVTTMSGRQAQIKVVDIRYIVTDLDVDQTASSGGGNNNILGGGGGGTVGSLSVPLAEPFELGPVLDVVPYVNADGYTIQMTLLPTLKEFLGYDDPGQFTAQVQSTGSGIGGASEPLTQPIPLPKFRLRQVATTAMVWDGQTVMLGGLIAETVQKQKDKIPLLGDIPYFGRFFRSESNISSKKNLVIFVTPRLIDPAGNPLHSEDEMPFAQNSIPTQRVVPQN